MRAAGIEFLVLVLREVVGLDVVSEVKRAFGQRLDSCEQLNQRRFAGAVHTDKSNAVASLNGEVRIAEDLFRAITLGHVLSPPTTVRPLGLGCGKLK